MVIVFTEVRYGCFGCDVGAQVACACVEFGLGLVCRGLHKSWEVACFCGCEYMSRGGVRTLCSVV